MSPAIGQRVKGVVLAGAHPWDDPSDKGVFLRPLVPVAHQPLIGYVLRWLRGGGIRQSTICANGASSFVRSYLQDGSDLGVELDYYEDLMPRGPAGCALDASAESDADVFVVADGTIIPQVDLGELLRFHEASEAAVTVVVARDRGRLNGSPARWAPTGIYVFQRRALDYIHQAGYQDTKEVLIPRLHGSGERVVAYPVEEACPRVTDASTYLAVNEWRVEQLGRQAEALPGYHKVGECQIHASARVASTASLVGPVLIGPGSLISRTSTLVGPTVVGAGCVVGDGAVVCRSVVWDRCTVGRRSIVNRCVLKNDATVQPDVRLHGLVHAPVRSRGSSVLSRLAWWRRPAGGRTNGRTSAEGHLPLFEGLGDVDRDYRGMASPQRRPRFEEGAGCLTRLTREGSQAAGQPAP